MNSASQIQILNEAICVSLCATAVEKGMYPSFSSYSENNQEN